MRIECVQVDRRATQVELGNGQTEVAVCIIDELMLEQVGHFRQGAQ